MTRKEKMKAKALEYIEEYGTATTESLVKYLEDNGFRCMANKHSLARMLGAMFKDGEIDAEKTRRMYIWKAKVRKRSTSRLIRGRYC